MFKLFKNLKILSPSGQFVIFRLAGQLAAHRPRITLLAPHLGDILEAGGKPSTWFPPGRLVEHI